MIMMLESEEARAEFEAAVRDAYDGNGTGPVGHKNAAIKFQAILNDAIQAHREWAHRFHEKALATGTASLLQDTWKDLGQTFTLTDAAVGTRSRSSRVGVKVKQDDGTDDYTQLDLLDLTLELADQKVREASMLVRENEANLRMYALVYAEIKRTGAATFRDALAGRSLDEFFGTVAA